MSDSRFWWLMFALPAVFFWGVWIFDLAGWRMIDRAEVERCRRKWLISAVAFPVFWLIHPLVLASGLAVCCG